jgi:hypothetical protein
METGRALEQAPEERRVLIANDEPDLTCAATGRPVLPGDLGVPPLVVSTDVDRELSCLK